MKTSGPAGTTDPPTRVDRARDIDQSRQAEASTWCAALGGSLLFLLVGLFLVLNELPPSWPVPAWRLPIRGTLLLLLGLLPAVGFGLGWVWGFPRWSYPYVGHLLLFSLYMMNVAPPELQLFGYSFGGSAHWAWLVWLPGLVMLALALLVSHSLRPAVWLVVHVGHDWTLWTWTLFGFLPLLVGMGFDEMDRRFSLPFMALITLVALATALVYLRSPRPLLRTLALVGGTFALVAIGVGAPAFYWQQHSGVDVLGSVKAATVLLALLFAPAAIGLLRLVPCMHRSAADGTR